MILLAASDRKQDHEDCYWCRSYFLKPLRHINNCAIYELFTIRIWWHLLWREQSVLLLKLYSHFFFNHVWLWYNLLKTNSISYSYQCSPIFHRLGVFRTLFFLGKIQICIPSINQIVYTLLSIFIILVGILNSAQHLCWIYFINVKTLNKMQLKWF